MKKSLPLLTLLLTASLLLSACGEAMESGTTTTAATTTVTEIRYDATNIKVRHVDIQPETESELSAEEVETIVSIWNDGDWEPQITKTAYDYLFEFSGNRIRYVSELGLFNDPENSRHLYVTEEERALINSFLE